jgi:uncharacterized protein (TIGR03435 family)
MRCHAALLSFAKLSVQRTMRLAMKIRSAALSCLIAAMAGQVATLPSQTLNTAREPTFEVSVVRLSKPDAQNSSLNLGEDRLQAQNMTLQSLVQFAYRLSSGSDDQILGGAKWMKSTRFDLEGKLDAETAAKISKMKNDERLETLRGMLKALLSNRFQLKLHQETRTLPVVRMQAIGETKLVKFEAPSEGSTGAKTWQGLHNDGRGHIEGRGADLKMLANILASQPEIGGRLVIDQTGLPEHARFTFELKWTPERLDGTQGNSSDAPGMSLFAAMREELGLKLTAGKAPIDVVVVDHVEMPDEN